MGMRNHCTAFLQSVSSGLMGEIKGKHWVCTKLTSSNVIDIVMWWCDISSADIFSSGEYSRQSLSIWTIWDHHNEYCFNVVNCFRAPKIYPVREVSEGGDVLVVLYLGAGAGGWLPLALRRGEAQHQVPGDVCSGQHTTYYSNAVIVLGNWVTVLQLCLVETKAQTMLDCLTMFADVVQYLLREGVTKALSSKDPCKLGI